MPFSPLGEDDLSDNSDYVQLSFPFEVQRVAPRPKPNHYSLAPEDEDCYEGGGFFYENCSEIFLDRYGYGPLRMAWDTNILSDYAEFGDLIWAAEGDDEFNLPVTESRYRDELVALSDIMWLWTIRDIRVRVPDRQIHDARRGLDEAAWEVRERQLHHFLAALRCIELDKDIIENVPPFDPLPEGSSNDEWDESLVLEAIENGCHIFLTRDGRLRRRLQQRAREAFMVIVPPTELLQILAAADELPPRLCST